MKTLYLRIWLTVVAVLALFALVSGWMWQRHVAQERQEIQAAVNDRLQAWAELVQRSLPPAEASAEEQAEALRAWSTRLHVPMALDSAAGVRLASSASFQQRGAAGQAAVAVPLDDGRTLWLSRRPRERRDGRDRDRARDRARPGAMAGAPLGDRAPRLGEAGPVRGAALGETGGGGAGDGPGAALARGTPVRLGPDFGPPEGPPPMLPPPLGELPQAVGPLVLVALLFVAVAAGAYPVVRRLTRRLEQLKQGVEAFGGGDLGRRVDASGRDEVAAVAATFNQTAERIEGLVRSHQSLLANASHELRSPLARLKMAVAMFADVPEPQRERLRREINTNVAELDALVEEVLLASRLDSAQPLDLGEAVDVLGIAAEEAARSGAELVGDAGATRLVMGSERLLRRALRNLLENARRYGGDEVQVDVQPQPDGGVCLRVCDRGPGVPPELRERIFEAFYRLPGHAEREGGVGLGLSLVRQIALRHGGSVHCRPREGGGSCFELRLPARQA